MTDVIKIDACIRSSPYPVWLATSRGECLYANPELERLIGLSSDQIRQADWCSFVLKEDRVVASASWQRSLASGTPYRTTVRLRGFDGVPETVELIAFGHTPNEGMEVWLFTGLYLHGATQQYPGLEAQLQATLNVIPAYTWYALPSGALTFVNERTGNYLGLPKDHPLRFGIDTGAEWDAHIPLLHPDDREESRRIWSTCVRTGSPSENSFRVRSAEGEYRWFLSRVEALRASDGTLLYWIGVNLDIDERKQAEERLLKSGQERERELVAIIQTVPSMLWSMSPTGEITHISERCLEFSGTSLEEIVSRGWLSFIHPDDRDGTAKAFFQAIETGESYNVIHRARRADGDYRWHHARAEPMRDPHGKIIQWYGLLNDIDERKRAEDHLRDTQIKLAKASRLTTVAELAASIAHELNQPLMSILANAQAAKRWLNAGLPNVTEVNLSIERTIRDARAADETMQHIRALFKQESFDKKDVNIPNILREVVRVVQEDPKKRNVPIECKFEESLPMVYVDRIQIQQVFINLIVNAIEALEGQQMARLVVLRAATDSNGMLIQVIDNGPGVDNPERIFDAFTTTKEKGMGIGLAVSRTIVEAHGGRLWAENNQTGGATFNMALPLSHAGATAPGFRR
jgi:PAS domain S-box-containing protein